MRTQPTQRQEGRLVAVVGGRGASLIRVSCDGDGGYRAEVCGTSRTAGQSLRAVADALTAALQTSVPRGGKAALALAEFSTRARLVATPPAKGATLRTLLAQDLDPDDVFISTSVGEATESGRTLAGHLVLSAHRAEVRTFIDVVETRGLIVEGAVAFDRAFLTFAAARAGDTTGAMKIVALMQPCWTELACIADGRPLFVRRVETIADTPVAERIGAALTEAQKTALVVRGRLKNTAPLVGCVLIDPMQLGTAEDVRLAADATGIETVVAPFDVTATGSVDPAVLCDAVRAAVTEAVRAEASLAPCTFDVPTRGMRSARRRRLSAAAAAVLLFWTAGFAARESMRSEARGLRSDGLARMTASIAAVGPDDVARAEARAASARFAEEHAGLLRFGVGALSTSDLLGRIAAAAQSSAACTEIEISLEQDEDGSAFHDVTLSGFVRGDFAGARKVVRALTSDLRNTAGVSFVEELEPPNADPRSDPSVPAARRITPFAVSLTAEATP